MGRCYSISGAIRFSSHFPQRSLAFEFLPKFKLNEIYYKHHRGTQSYILMGERWEFVYFYY